MVNLDTRQYGSTRQQSFCNRESAYFSKSSICSSKLTFKIGDLKSKPNVFPTSSSTSSITYWRVLLSLPVTLKLIIREAM